MLRQLPIIFSLYCLIAERKGRIEDFLLALLVARIDHLVFVHDAIQVALMRSLMQLVLDHRDSFGQSLRINPDSAPYAIRRPVGIVDEFVEPLLNAVDDVRVDIPLGINQAMADIAGLRERAEDGEHGGVLAGGQSGLVDECPLRSEIDVPAAGCESRVLDLGISRVDPLPIGNRRPQSCSDALRCISHCILLTMSKNAGVCPAWSGGSRRFAVRRPMRW